jgi:nicotinamide riboside transporter PnuC
VSPAGINCIQEWLSVTSIIKALSTKVHRRYSSVDKSVTSCYIVDISTSMCVEAFSLYVIITYFVPSSCLMIIINVVDIILFALASVNLIPLFSCNALDVTHYLKSLLLKPQTQERLISIPVLHQAQHRLIGQK